MTLIKKQRKDGDEPQTEKETASAEKTEASQDENVTAAKDEAEGKAEGGGDEGEEGKKPTEVDFLKFYLQQSLEDLKKQKDENEELKKQSDQLNDQLAHCKEKYDGLVAEYDNYRRRTALEKENLGDDATSKAVLTLLPALDNLERAMPFAESNPDSFKQGVEMTLRQLADAFRALGVEEIEAQGAVFDPELHDAVMHVEDDGVGESVVTDVFQKGYRLGDKVVRHSVVKVAN